MAYHEYAKWLNPEVGAMVRTERLVEALGGSRGLRRRIGTLGELRETVRSGLPYSALESVRERLGLRVAEAAAVIHLPQRTVARRRRQQRLQADESDRLVRLARVGLQAAAVLGGEQKAAAWLRRPNRALGGRPPLELLDTDLGARQVEDLLGRIAHGILS
jgi:putative toxin-antitoxin system antitoxin component (TIGR02293 family)